MGMDLFCPILVLPKKPAEDEDGGADGLAAKELFYFAWNNDLLSVCVFYFALTGTYKGSNLNIGDTYSMLLVLNSKF